MLLPSFCWGSIVSYISSLCIYNQSMSHLEERYCIAINYLDWRMLMLSFKQWRLVCALCLFLKLLLPLVSRLFWQLHPDLYYPLNLLVLRLPLVHGRVFIASARVISRMCVESYRRNVLVYNLLELHALLDLLLLWPLEMCSSNSSTSMHEDIVDQLAEHIQ